jgi:hypothetical protein
MKCHVVIVEYRLLGISPASEYYKPTFRNSVSVPSYWVGRNDSYLPMKMEPTLSSETSVYNIQTPEKFPEDDTLQSQHRESLKTTIILLCSRILIVMYVLFWYSDSLRCSVYCLCINVYCTTATGCQPNCS